MKEIMFYIALGILKGLAQTGNLTYNYMVECLENEENFELFKSKFSYKTEERDGILYVIDLDEIS